LATELHDEETLAFRDLSPDRVLNAVENQGYRCDGRLLPLNSYENRVYRIGLEDGSFIISKFYRPHRWSDEAIGEEHDFSWQLADAEIPVVPPIRNDGGDTLLQLGAHRFALFPYHGGRAPDFDNLKQIEQLGRCLGRLHAVGSTENFQHRPALNIDTFGESAYRFVLDTHFIPNELQLPYRSLVEDLLKQIQWCYERAGEVELIRLHGDCHGGNILWTDEGPHIVDLDDTRHAPAVQDMWMFLSGERVDQTQCLDALLEGYSVFRQFDARELHLIEALRTLRLIHYYAWIAQRWDDPAFPRVYPWFNTQRCWEQHILDLREQAALMNEAPLEWHG